MQTRLKWMLVLGVAAVTAACGDSKSSLLPTAPSALSSDSTNVDASTAEGHYGTTGNGPKPGNGNGNGNNNGNGNGNSNGNGNGNGNESGSGNGNGNGNGNQPQPPAQTVVQVEGVIDVVGDNSVTVNGQVIGVTTHTVIRHGNNRTMSLANLKKGDRVHVKARRVPAGLEADEINLQNPGTGEEGGTVLPPPPPPDPDQVMSVTAVDQIAGEVGPKSGKFRLTRQGTPTQVALPLTVSFALAGTANAGDYLAVAPTVTLDANQASVDVTVTPVEDALVEPVESVTLQLMAGPGYTLGTPTEATVNIDDAPKQDVSVVAVDDKANESGAVGSKEGVFRLTRNGSSVQLAQSLTVSFALGGTAGSSEYSGVGVSATFGANQSTVDLTLTPNNDFTTEPPDTVVLTLTPGADYNVGSPNQATITITDDPLPVVAVTASDPNASEAPDRGRFILTRTGSMARVLDVVLTMEGSATNGVDYQFVPLTLQFPVGSNVLTVNLMPLTDFLNDEGTETVVLTVMPSANYDVGSPSTATVMIVNVVR